jgi:polyisoprenoid-binding protein YceI
VRKGGFEPPRLSAPPPQDGVSASSTTSAGDKLHVLNSLAKSASEGISDCTGFCTDTFCILHESLAAPDCRTAPLGTNTRSAPIQKGSFDEDKGAVHFVVDARALRVLDSDVSDKDREKVQSTMVGPKVLDSSQFNEIHFRSAKATRNNENRWTVRGDLTLHGQTHPLTVEVERQDGRYRGSARLRQSEFGITPATVAGGTIKVKDEVRVEFEIVGK